MRLKVFVIIFFIVLAVYYFKQDQPTTANHNVTPVSDPVVPLQIEPKTVAILSAAKQSVAAAPAIQDNSKDLAIQKFIQDVAIKIKHDEIDYPELIHAARLLKMPEGVMTSNKSVDNERVMEMKSIDSGRVIKHWVKDRLTNDAYLVRGTDILFSRSYDESGKLNAIELRSEEHSLQLILDEQGQPSSEIRAANKKIYTKTWDTNNEVVDFYSEEIENGAIKKIDYFNQEVTHQMSGNEDVEGVDVENEDIVYE